MRHLLLAGAAVIALGAFATSPAHAQIARTPAAIGATVMPDLKTDVQWRGRRNWRGGRYGRYRYGGRGYRRGWRGPGVGVGLGLAAGAIIGGAIASQNVARADGGIQYCIDRFKSYDVASQTYLGYDGLRHACP